MCGIAGCFSANGNRNFVNMYGVMYNRGPDNFGWYKDDNLTLFHSRLSIIDKSEYGNQPFEDNNYVFAYNGEIYNYKELASKYNYRQEASCDGRVLFGLLREYGLQLGFSEADGMFAVAYYNKKTKDLYLARDCFGEKPLYIYTGEKDKVYFASQISYLIEMVGKRFGINYNMVNNYLFSGYRSLFKSYSQTFFKNVQAVEPGTYMHFKINKGKIDRNAYTFFYHTTDKNEKPATIEDVRKQLEYNVETRLRSDVPLAFCMSGGVDSNMLITTAKRVFGYNVHGFTIGNSDERYDESVIVNNVVKQLGIKHTYVNLDETKGNFLPDLYTIIENNSSPLVTISYYLHWLLQRTISSYGYKVAVSGTGGDELFSGYYDHYLYHIAQARDRQKAIDDWDRTVSSYIRNRTFKDYMLFVNHPTYREYLYPNSKYLDFSLVNKPECFYEQMFTDDQFKNRMCNELFYETVPPILHDDDLNSMFFSIENRSPMLQKDLWKKAMSMDSDRYIVDGVAKRPLRSVFHSIAPDVSNLIPVKKTGFNASLFEIFPDYKNELFSGDNLLWDIVDKDMVIDESYESEKDSMFLFNLLNVKLFLEIFG